MSMAVGDVQSILKGLDSKSAVCFDVDSTVITEEGIDVLADFLGVGDAVAALTASAMGGSTPFEVALQNRLELMQPTRQAVEDLLVKSPSELTPGIAEVVRLLRERGTHVYLVSGGFRQMINPVAVQLGLDPAQHVIANNILFNEDGSFSGFDADEFTSRSGGKATALQYLKDTHGYTTLVMVGDGATDLEARPPADAFIGFGGIAVRERVKNEADWFVTDFQDVIQCLK